MEKQTIYEIVLSEIERVELMKIVDVAVKAQGVNLNLGMVHHLCQKMSEAKPFVETPLPINRQSVERFDDTQPKQGEPANDTQ